MSNSQTRQAVAYANLQAIQSGAPAHVDGDGGHRLRSGNAAAPALALPLLQWAGYRSGAADNPHGALLVLLGLYCILPLVLKLAVMALMWRFPLDAAEQARLRAAIAARAAA